MKKILSVLLAAVMTFTVMLPVFAEGETTYVATFIGPSGDLISVSPDGRDIGTPYYFVRTENGEKRFVEDENGIYYLATDGKYYTRDQLVESSIAPDAKTYSPEILDPETSYAIDSGSTLSFVVETNEAYNAATALVIINGVIATKNSLGEYSVYVDRDFTIRVKESELQKTQFNVALQSGDGYRVQTLKGQNYKAVSYGEDFSFRVKINRGYSDADLSVKATRGSIGLEEFLGEDAEMLNQFLGNTETLVSNGVDADGCRTYTIKTITSDCKVSVSGVREQKKATALDWIKRILKMILDILGIDTGFLGIDVIDLDYYTVYIDDSNLYEKNDDGTYRLDEHNNKILKDGVKDIDYMLLTGVEDEFRMEQFNVMGGDSVTIEFVTYDPSVVRYSDIYGTGDDTQKLHVTWTTGGVTYDNYQNVWTAKLNRSTGKTYYVTTFIVDNIKDTTTISTSLD